jgi:hypothetical protein
MKPHLGRSARVLLALSLAACQGSVSVPKAPPAALDESEPNDTAAQATWFGTVYPGSSLAIVGHVTSHGSDLFDGFAFITGAPCTVRFILRPSLPDADLDLCVYDPWQDAYVACFDSPDGTEVGEFGLAYADEEFHLVVSSAWASSSYLLEIEVIPFVPSPEGTEASQRKGTLERVDGYRSDRPERISQRARLPWALGWIGEVDLDTGQLSRLPFAAYPEGIAFAEIR